MSNTPAPGSAIKVDVLNGYQHVLIPHGSGGAMCYFIGLFLLFWVVVWIHLRHLENTIG
ncbi:hypothetical protein [Arenicella chitinivorans]|uniref:hypothetical protein n=1 Tax=Arenicella chitinivorans TaxID=1329800 RepID=UPI001674B568|nr:hypothetical protein [Arenicella chitinivorans]